MFWFQNTKEMQNNGWYFAVKSFLLSLAFCSSLKVCLLLLHQWSAFYTDILSDLAQCLRANTLSSVRVTTMQATRASTSLSAFALKRFPSQNLITDQAGGKYYARGASKAAEGWVGMKWAVLIMVGNGWVVLILAGNGWIVLIMVGNGWIVQMRAVSDPWWSPGAPADNLAHWCHGQPGWSMVHLTKRRQGSSSKSRAR